MANNRMFLMHRPSGRAVYLGKRMGWGWYNVPDDIKQRIEKLFEMVELQEAWGNQDDFCVALETIAEGATLAEEAEYTADDNDTKVRTFTSRKGDLVQCERRCCVGLTGPLHPREWCDHWDPHARSADCDEECSSDSPCRPVDRPSWYVPLLNVVNTMDWGLVVLVVLWLCTGLMSAALLLSALQGN